jgi:hypothetical protein
MRLLAIELAASILTLVGMALGSTTIKGAACYLASMVFWFLLMYLRKMWGLLPLNVAVLCTSAYNFWSAL